MHKGKTYCYNPEYWATVGWFWPGYVPWKMAADSLGNSPVPWALADASMTAISSPCINLVDETEAVYWFTLATFAGILDMKARLDTMIVDGVQVCRWRLSLGVGSVVWSTALAIQAFPQKVVLCDTWDSVLPQPRTPPHAVPLIRLRPATWEESGSPYPAPEHP